MLDVDDAHAAVYPNMFGVTLPGADRCDDIFSAAMERISPGWDGHTASDCLDASDRAGVHIAAPACVPHAFRPSNLDPSFAQPFAIPNSRGGYFARPVCPPRSYLRQTHDWRPGK
jgi:hypothetical protein